MKRHEAVARPIETSCWPNARAWLAIRNFALIGIHIESPVEEDKVLIRESVFSRLLKNSPFTLRQAQGERRRH